MSPRRAKAVRGRAGDDPATALRDHLIETAQRLLAERRVTSITTRDIARAAQVSDGVLYNYFADKHELLLAALIRRYSGVLGRFDTKLPEPGTGTVTENLTRYATASLDLLTEALPIAAGLIEEPELLHRFMAAIHTEPFGPSQVQRPIIEYLRAEQRLDRIGPVVPEAVFPLLFGATMVVAFSILVGGRPREEAADDLPALIAALVRGLAP
jgi:AcrR family transcriptional regulator